MGKTSERTSVTVSIRDILLYLCSRWRVLLIGLLIGAVLGGAYSGYKSLKSAPSAYSAKEAEAAFEKLSETEQAIVQNNVTTLIHYLNQFDYYSAYDEKALFQKLNPESARVCVLTYFIDSLDEKTDSNTMIRLYESSLINDRFMDDVADTFGISRDDVFYYYDGIVRIGDDSTTTTNQAGNLGSSALVIRVYGENDEFVKKMTKIVKDSVDRIGELQKKGLYSVNLINETIRQNTGTFIYDRQEMIVTSRKTVLKNINDLKGSLDGDVLDAVEQMLREQYDGKYADIVFPEMVEEVSGGSSFHISKKWVVVGAAGLFIIALIVILIKYLLKGVIRCYDDIEYTYGIQVLGTYDDPKTASKEHKFVLDKWLKSLRIRRKSQDRESSVALIAKKLQLLARNHDIKNICVAIGPDVDTDETFISDVIKKTEGINVTAAYNILRNADAINMMLEADGVVLLEQMDKSRFASIDQERVMCSGNNIRILGAIVAE